eukprot:TRINITY_DN22533_c0_g1_i1.p1 TRINITY_DN22533_c0_g1~~TRINITY_DN22533_c0_g1_i1.p1  ORF type:complete len:364 (+),score=66.45 TRINITY_DN22533_c0_g1_i1:116-1207(+)
MRAVPEQPQEQRGPSCQIIPLVGVEGLDLQRQWTFGAAADREGDVFFMPFGSKAPAIIAGRRLQFVAGAGGDGCKWMGVALGGNGHLYGAPFNAEAVLEIPMPVYDKRRRGQRESVGFEIEDRELKFISGVGGGPCKWSGAASGPDGNVYCAPFNADSVLVVETEVRSLRHLHGIPHGRSKWSGAVAGADGKIYCAPYDAESVLVIDPEVREVSFIKGLPPGKGKWFGGASAPDGRIFFAPYNAESVLVINTETQECSYLGSFGASTGKWSGVARGFKGDEEDGAMYFVPYNADSVLWIDLATDELMHIHDEECIGTGLGKWFDAATAIDGRIVCSPWNADAVLVIDTKVEPVVTRSRRREMF